MSFMTNQIIKRNKKQNIYIYIYIYILYIYIWLCEYFNNLNENGDMVGTGIMAGICTSPYSSSFPTKKVVDSPYSYSYPVNAEIPRQNGDEFEQYPRGRVYLSSLIFSISQQFVRIFVFKCSLKKCLVNINYDHFCQH